MLYTSFKKFVNEQIKKGNKKVNEDYDDDMDDAMIAFERLVKEFWEEQLPHMKPETSKQDEDAIIDYFLDWINGNVQHEAVKADFGGASPHLIRRIAKKPKNWPKGYLS
jgi:hypothetical protein